MDGVQRGSYHLIGFSHLLDLQYELLILVLQANAFTIQLPTCLVQHALIFPQQLYNTKQYT